MSQIRGTTKDGSDVIYGCDNVLGFFATTFDKDDEVVDDFNTYGIGAPRRATAELVEWLKATLVNPEAHATYLRRMRGDCDPLSDRGIGAENGMRVVPAGMKEDHAPTVEHN